MSQPQQLHPIPTPLSDTMRLNFSPLLQHLKQHLKSLIAGAAIGLVAAIAACGGGTTAGVGSGGTGAFSVTAYSEGTITGFGSVIVNGSRYDDTAATVRDEDGPRSRSDLKLGMVVAVDGKVDSNNLASASDIRFDSALLGPVSAVSTSSKTFTIIGQIVQVDDSTVFGPSLAQGFTSIAANDVLEVHGFLNAAANTLQATLIERKSDPTKYKISGVIKDLQTNTNTLLIGNESFSFADIGLGSLTNGNLIKLRLLPLAPTGTASWVVTGYSMENRSSSSQERAELEGLITQINSPTQFSVSNILVDTSNASFPDGNATVAVGNRIEAKGKLVNGVLIAQEVKAESRGNKEIELKGTLSGLDTNAKTFVLRGITVSFSPPVEYDKGTEASLTNGANIEVKGKLIAGTATVKAGSIKFEN
jgi:hypothetical protein